MICPKCGSENVQAVAEQYTTGSFHDNRKTKGFGGCKACIGTMVIGPIGFFCGLCGMGKSKGKITDTRKTKTKVLFCCLNCGNKFEP
ncbi:MAG: hypothetical protein IJR91_03175 [Ruminococcus sp.]|nr:hypothetical protein [Ruminococcus sp.]